MPLIACVTAPPRPCQNAICPIFSVTRSGSMAHSPISHGRISLNAPSTSDWLVYTLPMPVSRLPFTVSSVTTSTSVCRFSSGSISVSQPPSGVLPSSGIARTSIIFITNSTSIIG